MHEVMRIVWDQFEMWRKAEDAAVEQIDDPKTKPIVFNWYEGDSDGQRGQRAQCDA